MSASAPARTQWRQAAWLTLVALALLASLRLLREGPKLSHLDFIAGGPGSLEFCDPANPRFLPVVSRSSPVSLALRTTAAVIDNRPVEGVLTLRTNTGKAIGPGDLLPTGGRKMNLLIIDPGLADFQAVRPEAGARSGEWTFRFTPHRRGLYRIFADFTPMATDQEMYASVDMAVGGEERVRTLEAPRATPPDIFERDGLRFTLRPAAVPLRAREPAELDFTVERLDHAPLSLRSVDGASARLVAFDQARTGFVNLRPEAEAVKSADAAKTGLRFKLTIPDPGSYVIWTRVDAGAGEISAPFPVEIVP